MVSEKILADRKKRNQRIKTRFDKIYNDHYGPDEKSQNKSLSNKEAGKILTKALHKVITKEETNQVKSAPESFLQNILATTRKSLMVEAQGLGIKNFRVLNKEELSSSITAFKSGDLVQVQTIVASAVSRWKSGWGTREVKQ